MQRSSSAPRPGPGRPVSVLLPAAELAALEHWAQRAYGALIPLPDAAEERPPGPAQYGPYTRYVHADGERMTFTRGRVVVAELRQVPAGQPAASSLSAVLHPRTST
ncbi:hypothetical protein [Streptomyces sp. PSKA30]|uniref:hypothetical protein n=1 Tax=Streptomyces sp. PSKA30 TaxID=2874597 RepID=UPI001CD0AD28|nr:hypothetical protein [Streptomyces sp. PSKA30]MBZ9642465.1 hypothetical protein [Streptomyces sp. PSKA30]